MLISALGTSDNLDITAAIGQAIGTCREQLGQTVPQAGILFTSRMDIPFAPLLAQVGQAFPGLQLIGCTTDGEITPGTGLLEDGVALLLMASDTIQFAAALATGLSQNAEEAFCRAFEEGCRQLGAPPALAIALPDGLSTTAISLDRAIQAAMGKGFPVFGGTAGDGFQFKETFQFFGTQVHQDAAPVLFLGGSLAFDARINIGVEPMGPYFEIDSAKDNLVFTIDGKKAADVYQDLLGSFTFEQQASQFPLAVYEDGDTDFYLRDPMHVDAEEGTVAFVGTFPEKCRARLVAVDSDHLLASAHDANRHLLATGPGRSAAELIFIFSCTSRKHVLGSKINQEISGLMTHDPRVPFFGFYCYGELGPQSSGGPTRFHNDTYVAMGIRSLPA